MTIRLVQRSVLQVFGNRQAQGTRRFASRFRSVLRADLFDGGETEISGLVQVEGSPAARRVRLYDAQSGRFLRVTFSAPTGQYSFKNMRSDREYILLADDYTRTYNAVVADKIKAET